MSTTGASRLFWAILGLFAGAVLVGGLLAPPIFNFILYLARTLPAMENFRDVDFNSIGSRTITVLLLAGIVPAFRWAGVRDLSAVGWGAGVARGDGTVRSRPGRLALGWSVGALSIVAIYGAGWWSGAYELVAPDGLSVLSKVLFFAVGALLLGILEETIFRGALFSGLRSMSGFVGGAVLSSLFFSAVHFADPDPAIGIVQGHWYSGLELYSQMFNAVKFDSNFFPFCLTLFVMSLVLCAFFERDGNLFFAMGLHAGWVWMMKMGDYFIVKNTDRLSWMFGADEAVARSFIALWMLLGFLVVALWSVRHPRTGGG